MPGGCSLRRGCFGLLLVLLVAASQGCTYLKYRGDDARDMMDLGVTWSEKPCYSVYACLVGFSSLGAGHVEGQFAGLGGGEFGVTRYYSKTLGMLAWTYEELGFGDFDPKKVETLDHWYAGPMGWVQWFPRRPSYAPA